LFSFELHLTRLCSLLSVQVFRPAANAPSSGGRHNSFIEALAWLGQTDVKDTSLCISCVEAFATQEERYKALLLQGMTELRLASKAIVRKVPEQLHALLADAGCGSSPVHKLLLALPAHLPVSARTASSKASFCEAESLLAHNQEGYAGLPDGAQSCALCLCHKMNQLERTSTSAIPVIPWNHGTWTPDSRLAKNEKDLTVVIHVIADNDMLTFTSPATSNHATTAFVPYVAVHHVFISENGQNLCSEWFSFCKGVVVNEGYEWEVSIGTGAVDTGKKVRDCCFRPLYARKPNINLTLASNLLSPLRLCIQHTTNNPRPLKNMSVRLPFVGPLKFVRAPEIRIVVGINVEIWVLMTFILVAMSCGTNSNCSAQTHRARSHVYAISVAFVIAGLQWLLMLSGVGFVSAAKNRGWLLESQLGRGSRPLTRLGYGIAVRVNH
jgi:hypothetical protein